FSYTQTKRLLGGYEMEKKKKRLTITLAESVLDDLEKMAKEKGLSKSALITIALGEYKKGQKWA
ncbi:CopG family transcriptional regulator, partial [Yersinia enterocolitica]